jgi:hypothetical protein
VAVAPKSTFPIWPTYAFAGVAALALYLCFATIWGWWPTARAIRVPSTDAPAPLAAHDAAATDAAGATTTSAAQSGSTAGALASLHTPPVARTRNSPVFDRWVRTTDGAKVPSLMALTHTGLFHPGYSGRPSSQEDAPSIKIGMVVRCRPIRLSSGGSELRAKFLVMLNSPAVRELVRSLTYVAPDASWKSLAGHGPLTLAAALTAGEDPMGAVPDASALFLPPTTEALYGRDSESGTLLFYVEPRTAEGQVPPASDLRTWYRRFSLALAIPGAFGDFLQTDLGLRALGHRKNQFGVWLKSYQPLTAMVDTQGLRTLPGSSPSNEFIGWAFSAPGGMSAGDTARDMLSQLCEYTLHLDGFEETLAGITE